MNNQLEITWNCKI